MSKDMFFKQAHAWCDANLDKVVLSREEAPPEEGWDGTPFLRGLRYRQRETSDYDRPWIARGVGTDYGVLEQLARTSGQWQRVIETCEQLLLNAQITLLPGQGDLGEFYLDRVKAGLRGVEGGLRGLLREQVGSLLVAGFSVHQVVDRQDGSGIAKFSFRRSNTVDSWLLSEDQRSIEAVKFRQQNGSTYVVPIEHCLIASWRPAGLDLEGVSPIRAAAPWIVAKEMIAQLWHARLHKYASPIIFITQSEDGVADTSNNKRLISLWDNFSAEDFAALTLLPGQGVDTLDLHDGAQEFLEALRYCDEQILTPLAYEGALVGLNGRGALSLAEAKDHNEVGIALAVINRCVDSFNGESNHLYHGIPQRILSHILDDADLDEESLPHLSVTFGEDDVPLTDIFAAVSAGLVPITPELQSHISQRLKLPVVEAPEPIEEEEPQEAPEPIEEAQEAPVEVVATEAVESVEEAQEATEEAPLQDTALNGAQVSSMIEIAAKYKAGEIGKRAALVVLQRAFLMPLEEAEEMLSEN